MRWPHRHWTKSICKATSWSRAPPISILIREVSIGFRSGRFFFFWSFCTDDNNRNFLSRTDYRLHSAVHANRPDVRCAIYIGCNPVVAVSSLKVGLLPLTNDAAVLGEVILHNYTGSLTEPEEREKLIRNLGPVSKVLLLSNHGALCCGETIEEAFYAAYHIVQVRWLPEQERVLFAIELLYVAYSIVCSRLAKHNSNWCQSALKIWTWFRKRLAR